MTAKPPRAPRRGWKGERTMEIRREYLGRLLEGEIAYLHVPRFLEPSWCAQAARRLLQSDPPILEASPGGYGSGKIFQLGLNFEAESSGNRPYFPRVELIAKKIRKVFAGNQDPFQKIQETLAGITGWKVEEARENGLAYLTDSIWVLCAGSGTPVHCDKINDKQNYFISKFKRQLSCNVFLSMPAKGGRFEIYRRRHDPKDPEYTYALSPDWTATAQSDQVRPQAGDLVLFDTAYYHRVQKTAGAGYRIAAHTFIGMNPSDETMTFWS